MTEPIYAQRYGDQEASACGPRRRGVRGRGRAGAAGGRHRRPAARPRRLPAHRGRGGLRAPPRPRRRRRRRPRGRRTASSSRRIPGGTDAATLAARRAAARCRARRSRRPPPPPGSPRSTSAASVHGGVDPTPVVRAARTAPSSSPAPAWRRRTRRPTCGRASAPDVARYLSPEEVTGRAPSPASDVYRLGLVAYLLLTGRHAFDGADGSIVAQEQLDGVVRPPQLLNPEVPPALAQIVMRALDKDPGRARHGRAVPGRHRARAALGPGAGDRGGAAPEPGLALDPARRHRRARRARDRLGARRVRGRRRRQGPGRDRHDRAAGRGDARRRRPHDRQDHPRPERGGPGGHGGRASRRRRARRSRRARPWTSRSPARRRRRRRRWRCRTSSGARRPAPRRS